jgi:hypothetical protein
MSARVLTFRPRHAVIPPVRLIVVCTPPATVQELPGGDACTCDDDDVRSRGPVALCPACKDAEGR